MKLYSIISNSCCGYFAHRTLYPHHAYTNGFVGSLMYDDEQFIQLAETYDDVRDNQMTLRDRNVRYVSHIYEHKSYPICRFGPVDISWIHSRDAETTIDTFMKRQSRSQFRDVEPIFVLCVNEMFQGRNDDLIQRFLNIQHKSVLITNNPDDANLPYDSKQHAVYVLPPLHQTKKVRQDILVNALVDFARKSPWFQDNVDSDKIGQLVGNNDWPIGKFATNSHKHV